MATITPNEALALTAPVDGACGADPAAVPPVSDQRSLRTHRVAWILHMTSDLVGPFV